MHAYNCDHYNRKLCLLLPPLPPFRPPLPSRLPRCPPLPFPSFYSSLCYVPTCGLRAFTLFYGLKLNILVTYWVSGILQLWLSGEIVPWSSGQGDCGGRTREGLRLPQRAAPQPRVLMASSEPSRPRFPQPQAHYVTGLMVPQTRKVTALQRVITWTHTEGFQSPCPAPPTNTQNPGTVFPGDKVALVGLRDSTPRASSGSLCPSGVQVSAQPQSKVRPGTGAGDCGAPPNGDPWVQPILSKEGIILSFPRSTLPPLQPSPSLGPRQKTGRTEPSET